MTEPKEISHCLKTHPEPFQATWDGNKRAEFRLNDRDFKTGQMLQLKEWDPDEKAYTSRVVTAWITHIQTGYCIPDGYCMLSFNRAGNHYSEGVVSDD